MEGLPISEQLSTPSVVTQIIAGTNITIDQPNGNVTINAPGGGPGGGVLTIAGLEGTVTLSSPDDSININVDGQDIGLTSNGLVSATAGDGIGITGTTDITISNSGVLSVSDGTRAASTGAIVLSGSGGVSVVDTDGTFAITNTGVTELTGGDGIGLDVQTGSVTVSNLGLLSASPGAGIGVSTTTGVATISNKGVRTLADLSGVVLLSGGTGVGVVTNTETNTITLSNTGITSLTAGTAIGITGSTITNNGVQSFYDLSGAITVSATGLTISKAAQNIDWTVNFPSPPVTSVNAQEGAILIEAGTGITVTNSETPSIQITNSLPGPVASGTIGQTGFTEETTGLATGQYYKAVTVTGMTTGGLVLATANGTPGVCASAWITTVIPTTDTITIWLAADPVVTGETWEAHYVVTSF